MTIVETTVVGLGLLADVRHLLLLGIIVSRLVRLLAMVDDVVVGVVTRIGGTSVATVALVGSILHWVRRHHRWMVLILLRLSLLKVLCLLLLLWTEARWFLVVHGRWRLGGPGLMRFRSWV